MTDEQLNKLEQLRAQSDAGGGRDKATTSNFVLYNLYRTAVMDAAPQLLEGARENAALRREVSEAEAQGYRRGLEAAVSHIKHNAVQTELLINPDSPRKQIEEWGIYVLDQTWRELEKKAAPDTEAGDKAPTPLAADEG